MYAFIRAMYIRHIQRHEEFFRAPGTDMINGCTLPDTEGEN